ncbi:Sporulation related domain-containing protein [Paracoccus seriniphilus]|uniref:Sporulation related domain-containing protein n=2 Tax=Paracoccus seriniphilus TaxID=184748 RepID=A0A239PM07_9RHOB|nr:SPOR domain-containing protein [Paracoccus seriniphilus]WCR13594.1 SPOR domain-containing protein [Paracoccus seriniphilus]SNT68818.1 Sporulation related domain-containing protein [Paracoccus seriniphilus]
MAVMDFREGGYVFSRHKVRREFSYDQHGSDDGQSNHDHSRFVADPDGTDSFSSRIGRLTHYLGALASVALMVGLMAWGWQLVSRDVSGVPVIRAVAGDARTAPEDPGGELSSYTGYAVNSVAEGAPEQPVQQVAIVPDGGELTDEDVPMGAFGIAAHEPTNPKDAPLNFDGAPVVPLSDSEARALAEARAAAEAERLALAAADVEKAAIIDAPASEGPVNEVITDENGQPAQTDAIAAALAEAQAAANPGILRASSRPAPRPRHMRVASAGTTATDARPAAPPAAPVPAAAASGPLVQIGAFDSNAIASGEWNRLTGKFGSLFSGKGQVIQKHQSNGRTFWRLRVAGFGSISEARQFCAALKSGGTDCLALAR